MSLLTKKVSSHYPFLILFLFVFISLTFVSLNTSDNNLTGFGVFDGFFSFLRTTPLAFLLPDIPSSQPLHKQLTLTVTPQDITLDKQIEATTFAVTPRAASTSLTSTDISLFSTTRLQTFFLSPLQNIVTTPPSPLTPVATAPRGPRNSVLSPGTGTTNTRTGTAPDPNANPPPAEQPATPAGEPSGNGGGSSGSSSYSGKKCIPDWNCELTPCIEGKQQVLCTDSNNCLIYNGQQRACNSQTDNLGTIPYDQQLVQDLPVETYYEEDQSALAGEYVDEEIKDEGISGWIIALLVLVVLGIGGGITWYIIHKKGQSPPPLEAASWTPTPSQQNPPPQPSA